MDENNNKKTVNKKIVAIVVVLFLATNIISLYLGSFIALYSGNKYAISKKDYNDYKDIKNVATRDEIVEFAKLFDINRQLNKYYYEKIDENALVDSATKGLASGLNDPYTVFMNKEDFTNFTNSMNSAYVGIGISYAAENGKIIIKTVFENSPAQKAGLHNGDAITKVNATPVSASNLDNAVSMMKGKEGEEVNLTILRDDKSFDVKVKRAKVTMNTVKSEMLSNNIGYIQLSAFDTNSANEFEAAAKSLKNKGMKGLVVDLRENGGGELDVCVDICSQFVDSNKVIVTQKYKDGSSQVTKSISNKQLLKNIPLVVLVNGDTASASEVFSGVIKDYKLGTLVGSKTFGKGIVQQIIPDKNDGTALKVTVSKYYTPNGENIHKTGFTPDVTVNYDYEKALESNTYNKASDAQLNKALELINDRMK
ncbi:S41 family peptidase [Clostridium sp. 19966]|uniref:S41 family peptidase n=1 Tax=Clostridium sp. 19966 TaxID=2768166 RepID=UPI0028DF6E88|nr:S41 family peptidase [Clostridium sp. 19966]MDT8716102.1 S41 family peptidase [Clostridium sp. 19966]